MFRFPVLIFCKSLVAFLCFGLAFAGEDVCAVKIVVLNSTGKRADPFGAGSGTLVELVNPEGKIVASTVTRNSEADLCDFGFGPHTVVVGRESCIPVTLRNVRLHIGETQKLYVVLNPCADYFGTKGCAVYFRISSSAANPLSTATVRVIGLQEPLVADRYGRVATALLSGSAGTYDISAPGHETQNLTIRCQEWEDLERTVVLKKIP